MYSESSPRVKMLRIPLCDYLYCRQCLLSPLLVIRLVHAIAFIKFGFNILNTFKRQIRRLCSIKICYSYYIQVFFQYLNVCDLIIIIYIFTGQCLKIYET